MAHLITFLTTCKKVMNPLKAAEGAKAMQAIKTGTSGPNSIVMPNVTTVTCKTRGDTLAPHVLRTDI